MNNNLTVFSEDVIPVYTTDTGEKVVLGRELHKVLGIGQDYSTWFKRMCKYPFVANEGYIPFSASRSDGRAGKPRNEHLLYIETAQEIARMQRTQIGSNIIHKLNELKDQEDLTDFKNNLTIFSTDLIPVYTTDTGEKVVRGRELHEKLEIGQDYTNWFKRMCEYGKDEGFEEGESYSSILAKSSENMGIGGRPKQDHIITLRMAKHIASIQKTNIGYDIREKLFDIEEDMNKKSKGFELDAQRIFSPSGRLDLIIELATLLKAEEEKTETLALECKIKDEKIAVLEPKAERCDQILQSDELLTVTKIAKEYGYSAQKFNQLLHDFEIQFWQGGQWFLYAQYQDQGYTAPYDYNYSRSNGSRGTNQQTRWTQKGRQFLYDFLKEKGIVPLIEREANAE